MAACHAHLSHASGVLGAYCIACRLARLALAAWPDDRHQVLQSDYPYLVDTRAATGGLGTPTYSGRGKHMVAYTPTASSMICSFLFLAGDETSNDWGETVLLPRPLRPPIQRGSRRPQKACGRWKCDPTLR